MAAGAGGCRPIWGCGGGGCTFAFFLGGWPCSGGGEKRERSAQCDRSVAGTYRAAVITGLRARAWSPANACHAASKQGTYSYPRRRLCCGTNLVDRSGRHGLRTETGDLDDQLVGGGGAHPCLGGGGGAYAACQGAAATGDWGGCAQGAGCGAWAGVVGEVQGAGAGAVGQGIGNNARWGVWPGGYWEIGGAARWGVAGMVAAPGIRAEASSAQAGRGAAGGGATAPGTCWVAALAQAGSDDMPPWSWTAVSIAWRSSGQAAVATYQGCPEGAPVRGLHEGRTDVGRDIGRACDGGGYRGEGRGSREGRHGLP